MKEMKASMVYFDMDGVLADFGRGVRELCRMEALPQDGKTDEAQDGLMWEAIRKTDRFYARLALLPGAKEMFDAVYSAYGSRCEILTGVPREDRGIVTAGEDKLDWTRRMLSDTVRVRIVCRKHKQLYCTGPDCVLIDDREKTIREWTARGGTGILHTSAEKTMAVLKEKGIL